LVCARPERGGFWNIVSDLFYMPLARVDSAEQPSRAFVVIVPVFIGSIKAIPEWRQGRSKETEQRQRQRL